MKIEKQNLEDHQVKLKVEVEEKTFEDIKRRAAKKVSRQTKIPGFRPGRAPYNVVVRQVGEPVILEEALDMLVQDIYPKIIEEAEIQPYGPGKLENIESTEPPVLEFIVPLEANVELGDYRSIREPYEPDEITEDKVDEVINDLRERQAILEPADRPVEEGDVVYIKLGAERTQADEADTSEEAEETQETEDLTLIPERSVPILVQPEEEPSASKSEQDEEEPEEWPFPGFSRQLIGMSKGDDKTLAHTFPEETQFESLRGVEAAFHFEIEDLKSRTLPELDEEFAKSLGEYESMDELRAEVRSQLEEQARQNYNENYDEQVIEQAIEQATIQYPPQMLEDEVDSVIHNLEHRLESQRMDMDLYLKSREMSMEDLREEVLPVAESRLKRTLVLYELARAEDIQLDQAEVQTEATLTMQNLKRDLSPEDARKLSSPQVYSNIVTSIMADLLSQRAIERIRKIASGEFKEEEQQEQAEEPEEPEAALEVTPDAPAEPASEVETGEQIEAVSEGETPQAEDEAATEKEVQVQSSDRDDQEASTSEEEQAPED